MRRGGEEMGGEGRGQAWTHPARAWAQGTRKSLGGGVWMRLRVLELPRGGGGRPGLHCVAAKQPAPSRTGKENPCGLPVPVSHSGPEGKLPGRKAGGKGCAPWSP